MISQVRFLRPWNTSERGLVSARRACRRCNLHTAALDCRSANAQTEKDHTDDPGWTFTLRTRDYIGLTHAPPLRTRVPKAEAEGRIKKRFGWDSGSSIILHLGSWSAIIKPPHAGNTTCVALHQLYTMLVPQTQFEFLPCIFCCTSPQSPYFWQTFSSHPWTPDLKMRSSLQLCLEMLAYKRISLAEEIQDAQNG